MTLTSPPPVARVLIRRMSFAFALLFLASVPIENARSVANHSLARVAGAAAFVMTVLLVLATGRLRIVRSVFVPALLFVAWATLSFFWSVATKQTTAYALTGFQLLALLLVVWQHVDSPRSLRHALMAMVAGGCAGSLLTLASTVTKHGGVARYAVGDPNDFGVMVAITATMTVYLLRTRNRSVALRVVFAAALLLQVVAIARTGSRTAAVAGAVGVLVLVVDRSLFTVRRLFAAALLLVGAYLGVKQFVGSGTIGRIGTTLSSAESGNFNERTTFWFRAYDLWQGQPLHGVGAGAFRTLNVTGVVDKVAHSVFLGLLAELGLIGLGLFLLTVGMSGLQLRFAPSLERRLWLAVFLAWLGAGFTLTFELRKMTWMLIALASSAGLIWSKEASSTRSSTPQQERAPISAGTASRDGTPGDDGPRAITG